eukprot:CAMPEP_0116022956 /NCGR_PEP_ID=MMETSP0321-20121206/11288_1 /TAXON_ID=163516 /ORGANISM="Leptocylindrus danicus var. danicus, Strain B650" /LENGTH=380 /DNA_ID=CAMNT_0003494111 /DNA_START=151 /DNA_END=1293 /DNA_ORIENTATION=-
MNLSSKSSSKSNGASSKQRRSNGVLLSSSNRKAVVQEELSVPSSPHEKQNHTHTNNHPVMTAVEMAPPLQSSGGQLNHPTEQDQCPKEEEEELSNRLSLSLSSNAVSSASSPNTQNTSQRTNTNKNANISSCWEEIDGTSFHVRKGPNYKSNKLKAPSNTSLYDTVSIRRYNSHKRTQHIAVELCKLHDVPHVLIIHFQFPYETPSMMKSRTDGAGGEVVLYLKPSARLLMELKNSTQSSADVRLFQKWQKECTKNEAMRRRFKCMGSVCDLKRHNLGWIAPYNGKPVLITDSGDVYRGSVQLQHGGRVRTTEVSYLELSANVHAWCYLAKRGFVTLIPKFKVMQIEVGFTIEGREDDELLGVYFGGSAGELFECRCRRG